MKAAMNGVLNLSVLDGWWGEGYDGKNGWAIPPSSEAVEPEKRDEEEAQTLYELLQDQVIPMFYRMTNMGHSPEWIQMAKHSIASLLPKYSASRMLLEYVSGSYVPAARQGRRYSEDGYKGAVEVAAWKQKVCKAWPGVKLRAMQIPEPRISFGEGVALDIAVALNGLSPQDVTVELLLTRGLNDPVDPLVQHFELSVAQADIGNGETHYTVQLKPEWCGRLDYRIRAYPRHALLTHPLEMGLMRWV
jgi:starch phosphorylase